MANGSNNGIIFRDGAGSRNRALPALDPAYFSVEEHCQADLIRFAQAYAKELKFFELDGSANGDWSGLLTPPEGLNLSPEDMLAFYQAPDNFSGTPEQREWLSRPHFALFMAYLDMLKAPRAQLDDLTRRHLDFYFREVLRFRPRPFEPDRVHVLFEPARGVAAHPVPKGTLLHAGKDATGKALHYATVDDLLVTQARVADIRRVYRDESKGMVYYNTSWQEGMKEPADYKYQALGTDLKDNTTALAESGFVLSSPLLDLSEGKRRIKLILRCTDDSVFPNNLDTLIHEAFLFQVSTEKGWEPVAYATGDAAFCTAVESDQKEKTITICLMADGQSAIVPHPDGIAGPHPALKANLNLASIESKTISENDLITLQTMKLESIGLQVAVEGLSRLAIRNDEGLLNPKGTFFPFGSWPKAGSAFIFSNREICRKPLDEIHLKVTWKGNPENFGTHYKYYPFATGETTIEDDSSFTVSFNPEARETNNHLFTDEFTDENKIVQNPNLLKFQELKLHDIISDLPETSDPLDFPRFFKIILNEPDFQHDNFTRALINNQGKEDPAGTPIIVNPPYTPEIQTLSVDYTSGVQSIGWLPGSNAAHRFFHLHPFGYAAPCLKKDAGGSTPAPTLLPQPAAAGNLFIGLTGMENTGEISLLLQLLPGTTEKGAPTVQWSYLNNNCWTPLEENQVLIDRSRNLLNTGLLRLKLPAVASLAHTAMPAGLYWLKASATENAAAAGELISIHAQAAEAVWQDNGNAALHLAQPLTADSIKELVRRDPSLRAVKQPYTSFAGRLPEPDERLYTRAAERLRHKQRALTAWDYERLVLDRFPELYKVKCLLNWEKPYLGDGYQNPADGKVVLVVIPDLANRAPFFPLQPRISNELRETIEAYLRTLTSPFAEVVVRNPRFEFIRYRMDIRFQPDHEDEYYRQELNRALQRFLSPWAYEAGADIGFGSRIYHSEVIYFLEKLPYVDYVVNFKLVRQYLEEQKGFGCIQDLGYASASFPDTILVSHSEHIIGEVPVDDYLPADYKGVGYDKIAVDLRVYEPS